MKEISQKNYLIFALISLVLIFVNAFFITDLTVRNSVGHVMIIVFLYCLVLGLLRANKTLLLIILGIAALGFEISLTSQWPEQLNLQSSKLWGSLAGTEFIFEDLWAYLVGCGLIYLLEHSRENKRPKRRKFF
ncbi:MAG: DUF2809 domain-containing protein [Weeksellaceae bacterium]